LVFQKHKRTEKLQYLSSAILASRGSIHPGVVSQCESRKTITSPVAFIAPAKRDLIKPDRFLLRTTMTFSESCFTWSSSGFFKFSENKKKRDFIFYCQLYLIN